jgi:hypothetical protein
MSLRRADNVDGDLKYTQEISIRVRKSKGELGKDYNISVLKTTIKLKEDI